MTHIKVEFGAKPPDGWFGLAEESLNPSAYYTKQWLEVLTGSFDYYHPHFASAWSGGELVAGLPIIDVAKYGGHKVLSLPMSYGGPIAKSADNEAREAVAALFGAFAARLEFPASYKRFSLDYRSPFGAEAASLEKRGFKREVYDKAILGVSGKTEEQVWNCLVDRKERNSIRKAEKSGVEVRGITAKSDFEEAWKLVTATAARLGVQPDRKIFIENIFNSMNSAGLSKWLGAYSGGRMVGVTAFFFYGDSAIYFLNASDSGYWSVSPNSLLLWQGIREAIGRGCTSIDLGSIPREHPGLRKFKLSFGAEAAECVAYSKSTLLYRTAMTGRRAFLSARGALQI
ncbi:hypothetical protein COX86_00485 [Candidatus Micrarchaeota archaeon CG_4_10_14_0_2_um_filter_60_11]|nr:MAG: hypothetical protein AUJ16_00775 [Candidatus Micrarchaeota archaeon CG1_02_60_51]PIN96068.1 MAG: hypothetical protein COU39_02605 [Candidatus Micrarchaeota archaeon CG10_big_fil_rev_8_21_14_0_10_60_32]PIO01574.1 MAG: hypothetical protein COT58_04225 [Candidatus Micrarchaeota archaeon CG09_land_8_20_14_0_10_60_16]PIY91960.1 MAG: hypothetical protein COY71_00355 [Candidatus Micrarchaeota archaeon CG_4_10_14_0_8_um_filter_60_7]PIZ91300.1 MAG: hypothetical protein COX86_00485 [Candidatus Mi